MISLSTTTHSLEVVLAGSSVTPLDCSVAWKSITASSADALSAFAATSGTTPVTLVAAPASGERSLIEAVVVYNPNAAAATVTIRVDVSGTKRIQAKVSLLTDERLAYTDGSGWSVYDATGAHKEALAAYVLKAGDTMSGALTIANGTGVSLEASGDVRSATGIHRGPSGGAGSATLAGDSPTGGAAVVAYGSLHATLPNVTLFTTGAAVERARIDANGNLGVGTGSPISAGVEVARAGTAEIVVRGNGNAYAAGLSINHSSGGAILANRANTPMSFTTNNIERMRLGAGGEVSIGTAATAGAEHTIQRGTTSNDFLLNVTGASNVGIQVYSANNSGWNAAGTVLRVGMAVTTSRSINAGGTINASGADYAEYEFNNGTVIPKGSVVGFDSAGALTTTFGEAVRFGIKSTNPSLVGGDTWGAGLDEPASPKSGCSAEERAAYELARAEFDSELEARRAGVDRISYCGKVPVNVLGCTPGGYVIASADSSGAILGVHVADPTFAQYKLAVGRVNRILPDGRAEVAVIVH